MCLTHGHILTNHFNNNHYNPRGNIMNLNTALNRIIKRCPTATLIPRGNGFIQVKFPNGSYVGEFITRNGSEYYCSNWHIRAYDDHTDTQTDYFAGFYRSNCKQFIDALLDYNNVEELKIDKLTKAKRLS